MRRGFKAEANWYARQMRAELKAAPHDPLCPRKLAQHLGFPVVPLSKFADEVPEVVQYLASSAGQKDFSAITLFCGTARMIVHNDSHSDARQAANIAHELAHGILLHPPKPPFDAEGSRHYDKELEDEANWLGPALLVSEEAAMLIVSRQMPLVTACTIYGVSMPLMQMRLGVTGARKRFERRWAAAG